MSLNSDSNRFDPRWLFPAIGTDGAELYGPPDASPCSAAEESTNEPTGHTIRRNRAESPYWVFDIRFVRVRGKRLSP